MLIEGFWVDLYGRNFRGAGARFDEKGEYTDVVNPGQDITPRSRRDHRPPPARLRQAVQTVRRTTPPRGGRGRGDDRARRALGVADRRDHGARRGVESHEIRDGKIIRVVCTGT